MLTQSDIVNLPHGSGTLHNKIFGYYNSKLANGMRVRDWVNTLGFEEQYDFGIQVLERFMNAE
jgi:hypothetical protein